MRGRELSARFWADVVEPALDGIGVPGCAAVLLGPGSEVLGFDDARSFDHDMGPRVQVLLPDRLGADVDAVADRLDAVLPERFDGRPVRFATTADPVVRHRVVLTTVGGLFVDLVGLDPRDGLSTHEWLTRPTQVLASIAEGAVFADPDREVARARDALAWYPDPVWRHVLGCQWRRLAQHEPLLGRTAEAGDDLGARLVAARLARELVRLAFLIERRWAPYDKWLGSAFRRLGAATDVGPHLERLVAADGPADREAAYLAAGTGLAARFVALGLVEVDGDDVAPRPFHDRPYLVLGADRFASACRDGSGLEAWGWRGAIDQWVDSVDVLTDVAAIPAVVPRPLDQPSLPAGPFGLRPFTLRDLDVVREGAVDPSIPLGTTVPAVYTDAAARSFIERQWRRATSGEGWSWAIARSDTDRAVGQVGLWPRGDGRATIGYWVATSARRAGAATHALDAVVRFAFDEVELDRLELHIDPANAASIATAKRCGFELEGVLRAFHVIGGTRRDMAVYARLREPRD